MEEYLAVDRINANRMISHESGGFDGIVDDLVGHGVVDSGAVGRVSSL